jgi:hypothetical protein
MIKLRDHVQDLKLFPDIDLVPRYNLSRIRAGDKWKTAVRTRYGHYEYLVMPFGMANAPASFYKMIDEMFKDMNDLGVVAYIDDLVIYSHTKEEHEKRIKEGLNHLHPWDLAVSLNKYKFHKSENSILGFHDIQYGY